MPAISATRLVDAVTDAIQQSGYGPALVSAVHQHPRKFVVTPPDGDGFSLWIYIWTLTFGGRPNLPDEYRIQMTTVTSPLATNPAGLTVLLGFEPSSGMFAGFDLNRHRTFTTGSPSVQIDINTVREALQHGLTFDRKSNDEIAVGVRPDQLVNYALNAEHLHRYGKKPETFQLLTRAATLQDISDTDLQALSEPRRRIVQAVARLSRSSNFRQQVIQAYDSRCAVTRVQLRLVDAAHILPVGAPGSTDHVTNGLALSPTYHRAYDGGLIYLDEQYIMRLNEARLSELQALNLTGGVEAFRAPLGRILLPPDPGQRPLARLIRKANVFRRIPA